MEKVNGGRAERLKGIKRPKGLKAVYNIHHLLFFKKANDIGRLWLPMD